MDIVSLFSCFETLVESATGRHFGGIAGYCRSCCFDERLPPEVPDYLRNRQSTGSNKQQEESLASGLLIGNWKLPGNI